MTLNDIETAALAGYRRLFVRRVALTTGLLALAAVLFVMDLVSGPSSLGAWQAIQGIFDPASLDRAQTVIVHQIRLPHAAMAVLAGFALSVCGAELQTVLHNPLASPFTLGVASAASFGAALGIILGIGLPGLSEQWSVPANAFLFSLLAMFLLQVLSRMQGSRAESTILLGTALMFSFNALLALTQFLGSAQAVQQIVFWTLGSLSRSDWSTVLVLAAVIIVVTPMSFASSWRMTALRLGEERAMSFGVDVARLRLVSLIRVSLMTATAIAVIGTVSFVGLVGPHVARLLIGEDHRFFLPTSGLAGAILMSAASIASKSVMPGVVLPLGVVTALVGVPLYVVLIMMRSGRT